MREVFEHTADLGVRVRASDFDGLIVEAALALFEIIAGDLTRVQPREQMVLNVSGDDPALLLHDVLAELLYLFDTRRLVACRIEAHVRPGGVMVSIWGERFDPSRHGRGHEVKAITYHELDVRRTAGGWEGTFIVDI